MVVVGGCRRHRGAVVVTEVDPAKIFFVQSSSKVGVCLWVCRLRSSSPITVVSGLRLFVSGLRLFVSGLRLRLPTSNRS